MNKKSEKKHKKIETSKIMAAIIILYGIANGIMYNIAVFTDRAQADPALAIQSVITIVGGYFSYLLYNFSLKNSRNKFGISEDGEFYIEKNEEGEE